MVQDKNTQQYFESDEKSLESESLEKKKPNNKNRIIKQLQNIMFFIFFISCFAIMVVLFKNELGEPVSLKGYTMLNVISSSMEPAIPKNSLVITKSIDVNLIEIGDDITYRLGEASTVTHRVIEIWEDYEQTGKRVFRTKGIANELPDSTLVFGEDIIGKVVFKSYIIGSIILLVRRYGAWIGLLCMLCYGFVVTLLSALESNHKKN